MKKSSAPYSPLSTEIHRKEKVAKRKEERTATADGNNKDQVKSGPEWSEQPGAPHGVIFS
ncbi:MAG: hypothetical protein AABZ63_07815 [Actinomycetota bacterium]